jgi:hypothetical protein
MSSKKDKITEKLKELFALTKKVTFFDCPLKDGSILRTEDEALAKGSEVKIISKDGVESDAPDGDVTSQDGNTISIKSGVVDAIAPATPEKANEKMDTPPTPVEGAPAPQSEASAEDEAPIDMDMLQGIIQNLVDRIAALEAKISDTSMTVEKMSALPAAKQFNFDPMGDSLYKEGSVGYEIEKFKAEKKAKRTAQTASNQDAFSVERKEKPKSQQFSKNDAPVANSNKSEMNLDSLFGSGFSVGA